jgi:uncharacterized protein YebE (UPF0316 family)
MFEGPFVESAFFAWVILPLVIFAARSVELAIGTLRIVFIAQGRTALASTSGFFEVLIWLLVVSQALQNLANPLCVVAYAGGFASGHVVGIRIEERLAMGLRLVRVILRDRAEELVAELRRRDFGVTVAHAEGSQGPVKVLFTVVRRRHLSQVIETVRRHNPQAFFTIEDVRQAEAGVYPLPAPHMSRRQRHLNWRRLRLSK